VGKKVSYAEAVKRLEDSPRVSDSPGSPSVSRPEERERERERDRERERERDRENEF
jgi:hypothetical protein